VPNLLPVSSPVNGFAPLSASSGQLSFEHRSSNTGVQTVTDGFRGSRLDWLDFTVKSIPMMEVCRSFLGFNASLLEKQEGGARGHSEMWQVAGCTLLTSPDKPERGVKVVLSAKSLAALPVDHLELLRKVLHAGGSVARIDVAFDDCTGVLSPALIDEMEDAGKVVSHFSRCRRMVEKSRQGLGLTGDSLTFGSRFSERFVRVYDKRLEQIHAQGVAPESLPAHWCWP
jgi:hypothetical protein